MRSVTLRMNDTSDGRGEATMKTNRTLKVVGRQSEKVERHQVVCMPLCKKAHAKLMWLPGGVAIGEP